jgi:hypothetical protein
MEKGLELPGSGWGFFSVGISDLIRNDLVDRAVRWSQKTGQMGSWCDRLEVSI